MEFLSQLESWHWLTLGLVLLGLEALGIGGFLIGAGVAALLQALTLWVWPSMSWQLQWSVFALDSVVLSFLYWKYFKNFNQTTDHEAINDRASQMIGHRTVLAEDLPAGQNKLQFGDTYWKVHCKHALKSGDSIEVVSGSGMLLEIEKIS